MPLHLLNSASRLITDVDPVIINLCEQLGIKTGWINIRHDHMHLALADSPEIFLTSASMRTNEDVYTTPDVFLNILLDIASGSPAKLAYEKQGYTYENAQSTSL